METIKEIIAVPFALTGGFCLLIVDLLTDSDNIDRLSNDGFSTISDHDHLY